MYNIGERVNACTCPLFVMNRISNQILFRMELLHLDSHLFLLVNSVMVVMILVFLYK